jgi:alpha-tubulin suppressor-like RCC1 family protein
MLRRVLPVLVAAALITGGACYQDDTTAPQNRSPIEPLIFVVQPSNTSADSVITPAVQVAIVDASGKTDTTATNAVTMAILSNPGRGNLLGTTTVKAARGIASFVDLLIDRPSSGYTLVPRSGPLRGAPSAPFDVHGPVFAVGAFVTVSAGGTHTCGVTAAGAAYCWGANGNGQLGDGTLTQRTGPVPVAGGLSFRAVIAGSSHTCGVTPALPLGNGVAYCWGLNDHGQLGDGTTTDRASPVAVAGGLSFFRVVAGGSHTCGVTPYTDSSGVSFTYCWGWNASGQLGDGTTTDRTKPQALPFFIGSPVSAGLNHTCALQLDVGADYCWGSNTNGQLGDGTTIGKTSPVAIILVPCGSGPPDFVLPPGLTCPPGARVPFEAVSAGGSHTCAEAGGSYFLSFAWYCWGANGSGQLGDGTTTDRTSWVLMGGGLSFAYGGVSAGGRHTCGATAAGSAYCWGLNDNGQLGDGTTTQRTSPVLVAGGLSFIAMSAGGSHTCGVTAGAAYCWGLNSSGQLGNGTTTGSTVPVKVAGPP